MNVLNPTSTRAIALQKSAASSHADEERATAAGTSFSRPLLAILTIFWIYVALSNVLYAHSMSMEFDPDGKRALFASWEARVVQHVLLFPLLLGAIWVSLRVGWRPTWRALPIQLLLGLVFAMVASPLLHDSEYLMNAWHGYMPEPEPWSPEKHEHAESLISPGWIGSATSFFLQYTFAVALVTGFAVYQRFRDSELRLAALERAWNGARLAALRMQLSPHTLFNLLHTIRGHIGWDPAAAQSMIVQLGDLLRRLLTAGERDFTRLREELDFVRLYLELQQRRFADRLSLVLPDSSKLPQTWVPSLILQPLIENAVTHGLADHVGSVTVRVEISASEDGLTLRVVNTMAPGHARQPDGVGLRNVRDRLAVQFGNRATFDAGAVGANEWLAEIHMPLLGAGPRLAMTES
jgi:Histidine kinase